MLFVLFASASAAFTTSPLRHGASAACSTSPSAAAPRAAVRAAASGPRDLTPLGNTDALAATIASTIATQLDDEWCEQEDHARVGSEAGRLYCEARSGTDDVGELLMAIGTGMQDVDMGDCFVGTWDIANMASDIIMNQNYGAGYGSDCACSGPKT